jgi:oligopeptide transport system substrate-binding protein
MRRTRLHLLPNLLCPLVFFAAIFSGCSKRETAVQRGNREQVLHRGIGEDVSTLDPHLATQANDYTVISALLEGLVSEDPVDLHPVPGVAESWDVSADDLVYTFHLRADARWSDGAPVTARDFIDSFQRILTPSLGADNASLLYVVRGARAFNEGRLTDFTQVGFAAPDPSTLRITLAQPTPQFLSLLNQQAWFPVPRRVIEKSGPFTQRGNPWAQAGRFVGNGPFVLKEWRPGQEIVVVKSPTYWDAARVRLNEIHFHAIDSLDAEERAFRAGQLHVTEALPPARIDAWRRDAPQMLRIDPLLGTYFYRLNTTRPFLNDKKIRRALALAIDRTAIVKKILRGGQVSAGTLTPPGIAGYTPPSGLRTDFAEARQLLATAGHPGGQGLPTFELLFNSSETHQLIAEAVREMWRRELGVNVRLVNEEVKSTLDARRTGDFQILRSVWIADYADPASFLDIFRRDSGNNFTSWLNPGYDRLLDEAARTPDPAARNTLFHNAETLLLDDAPIIPVYFYTHVFLIQPSVKGWYPTLLDHHPYKYVSLDGN